MIICPSCKKQLLEGSFYCTECGAQLIPIDSLATQSFRRDTTDSLRMTMAAQPVHEDTEGPGAGHPHEIVILLNMIDAGQTICLQGLSQYQLGRFSEGGASGPDVDLTPFDGFALGVSRQHAVMKVVGQRVYISDIGSSNGTRVNGQKINPKVEFPLNHGDMIALGKLKIQFLIHR